MPCASARAAAAALMRMLALALVSCAQEFDVDPSRTVREEFYSVYDQQVKVGAQAICMCLQATAGAHCRCPRAGAGGMGACQRAWRRRASRERQLGGMWLQPTVPPPAPQALKRQEQLSVQLESVGNDMERMQALLDELDKLNNKVIDMDVDLLDKKIDQMMPELGFK